MKSDIRYKIVGTAIKTGVITTFREVFAIIPMSTVAVDMNMGYQVLHNRVYGPLWLSIKEVIAMAKLLDMDPKAFFTFVATERKDEVKSPGLKFIEAQKKA